MKEHKYTWYCEECGSCDVCEECNMCYNCDWYTKECEWI